MASDPVAAPTVVKKALSSKLMQLKFMQRAVVQKEIANAPEEELVVEKVGKGGITPSTPKPCCMMSRLIH